MAMGLTDELWTVLEYVRYPVHVGEFQRAIWAEDRENLLTTGLNRPKRPPPLPTSWRTTGKGDSRKLQARCAEGRVDQDVGGNKIRSCGLGGA
jgi:hypothetical protein